MKHLCVIVAVLISGCVTKGTHEALQRDHDAVKADLERCRADNAACQASLEKTSRDLGARIVALNAKLDSVTRQKEALESDKSTMLKDKSRLQASIDEMKTALAELSKRKAEADARLNEFKALLDRFKALIDAGKLQVKIVDGRMVVALASDVLFGSGSAKLSADGKGAIGEVGKILSDIPGRKFQVEGHTDNVPMKTAQYPSNWELAAARALTVVKAMVDAGMPADRISAASFGEFKPAKPNDSPEGKASNRRIDIVVVPDLSSLPGFDELKKVGQ
ncbi:MAG: flagellar motor protein MotB [Deltaproteobacteria bacterium]|nr:flagellar motor protein MotB [Deltaproteobacteria bacterium]